MIRCEHLCKQIMRMLPAGSWMKGYSQKALFAHHIWGRLEGQAGHGCERRDGGSSTGIGLRPLTKPRDGERSRKNCCRLWGDCLPWLPRRAAWPWHCGRGNVPGWRGIVQGSCCWTAYSFQSLPRLCHQDLELHVWSRPTSHSQRLAIGSMDWRHCVVPEKRMPQNMIVIMIVNYRLHARMFPLEYFKLAILRHLPFSNGTIELFLDLKSCQGPRGSFSLRALSLCWALRCVHVLPWRKSCNYVIYVKRSGTVGRKMRWENAMAGYAWPSYFPTSLLRDLVLRVWWSLWGSWYLWLSNLFKLKYIHQYALPLSVGTGWRIYLYPYQYLNI